MCKALRFSFLFLVILFFVTILDGLSQEANKGSSMINKVNGLSFSVIDLSHIISPDTPSWTGDCGFKHELLCDYHDCTTQTKFRGQKISMFASIGTHMDAPAHCIKGGKDIASLDIKQLCVPCVVINIADRADERYMLSVTDVLNFEEKYGMIKQDSFVIVHTGWDRFWDMRDKYHNNHVFPSISAQAASLLLERGITGLGIDTLSPDRPDNDFPVHQLILGAGKYIIENIAHADQMPVVGGYLLALPLKIKSGTEAPMRLVGLVMNQELA